MNKKLIEIKGKRELDMEAFQFVLKALILKKNKYDKRIYIDHVLIEDGFAYGTDSRRLHRAKLEKEYENGLYRVFKNTKTHIILFLELERDESNYPDLTPVLEKKSVRDVCRADFYPRPGGYIRGLCKIIRALPETAGVNPDYLSCLEDEFDVMLTAPGQIVLENHRKTAVVMTMHADL